jgi:formate/nitrite transporter FocA (FNT family)
MNAHSILVVSAAALATVNSIETLLVVVSSAFARGQKARICGLIWLVPLLGAIGVAIFLSVEAYSPRPRTNVIGAVDLDNNAIDLSSAVHRDI